MDFIRNDSYAELGVCRELPPTEFCDGAYTSTDKGQDSICCCFCYIIRCAKYRKAGIQTDNILALEFLEKFPMARDSCYVSRCNKEKPLVFHFWCTSELIVDSYMECLKEQFKVRQQLRICDKRINNEMFAPTRDKVPIVVPCNETIRFKEETADDSGVEVSTDKRMIKVKNLDEAFKSGKWMHVINYHQTIAICMHQSDKRAKDYREGGWYLVF